MPDPFATSADLAQVWRPLTTEESTRANAELITASAIIRLEAPDIDDRIAADPPTMDASIPKRIACQMVRRVMAPPPDLPGVSQQTQSVGAISTSFTLTNPSGDLYLTKAELRMIGARRQRAATVSLIIPVEEVV